MDTQALAALEFDVVLQRLEAATATPFGAELARSLHPAATLEDVELRQTLTGEGVALLDHDASPPLNGIRDVRPAVERAAAGGVLDAAELAETAAAIEVALRARSGLQIQDEAPTLREIAAGIDEGLAGVAERIRAWVEEDGSGVRDSASPLLRRLRRELRAGRQRVEETMQRMVRAPGIRPHLQESFVAQRSGRPVLAVKATARAGVPGIVHDASGSGQTLFIEPLEVVELSNQQSETAAREREEVERLLRELSGLVGERAEELVALTECVGALDLAVAAAALSRAWSGVPVTVGRELRLVGVRHPLLDPATTVPIDLELGSLRSLVISGPNTGGKTVALKTIGLAVLIHQAGLRPPAREVELPIFDAVLVEIGDQQSIAMSLSTFAAHVRNLIDILGSATEATLILVDELASGTDPVEGAALGQALLEEFAARARFTAVTTHYPELKAWASVAEHAANASTAIDPETFEPLYRVVLGRAGTSYALETAERLGLDAGIVAEARGAIAPARQRTTALLAEAEAAERAAATELEAAQESRREANVALEQARARESELAAEVERVRASAAAERDRALAEAQVDLAAARGELAALRDEIRAARRRHVQLERAPGNPGQVESERDRHLGAASMRVLDVERELSRLEAPPAAIPGPLAVGDAVEAPAIGVRGTIAAIEGDDAEVVGASGQRVRVPLARLRPLVAVGREPEVRVRISAPLEAPDEIDVRGGSAYEARTAVRVLVDNAAAVGHGTVRVIHGRGTGVLKQAVRDELRRHPHVREIRPASADGATVARLSD